MKFIITILLTGMLINPLTAQNKITFSSQNMVGLLEGENGSAFQIQTINGITYKKWFTGLGTGLDYYYLRSIPAFVSVQHNILNKKRTPFLTVDAGINFPWVRNETTSWNEVNNEFSPSLYMGGNVGYKLGLKNNDALLLLVGYSFKELKEKKELQVFCVNPPCPPMIENYEYSLKRLSFRLGYQF